MKISICGVPEHFNFPWQMAIENKVFEAENIFLEWKNVPEGTGKMCELLKNNDTNIAIVLTEGIIKAIGLGNTSVIVQKYIETPLVWGVHIPYKFQFQTINDLEGEKIAISRLGSGSHLMSMLWAKKNKWNFNNNQYEIVNTIDGAVKSLTNNESTVFMWEKFMTKPFVDAQIFQKIDEFPTPWACFAIAVNENFLNKNTLIVQKILKIINSITKDFKKIDTIETIIANKYALQTKDVKEWLQNTEWSQENFEKKELDTILEQLIEVNIISQKIEYQNIIKNLQ